MFETVDGLNERLAGELKTPLAIGVGIHTGRSDRWPNGSSEDAHRFRHRRSGKPTARLEGTTKSWAPLVVSVDTLRAGSLTAPMPLQQISLRGRFDGMAVAALDAKSLRNYFRSKAGRSCSR
jgi:hypothetical protein